MANHGFGRVEMILSRKCLRYSRYPAEPNLDEGHGFSRATPSRVDEGFSPEIHLFRASSRSVASGLQQKRTSAAKATRRRRIYGTAEAVPFV
jgi:hypothetical protein